MSKMTSPAIVAAIYLESVSSIKNEIVDDQWKQLARQLGGWLQELEPSAIYNEARGFLDSFSNQADRRAAILELSGELKKYVDATEDEGCMIYLMGAVADAFGDACGEAEIKPDEEFLSQVFAIVGVSWEDIA